MEKGVAEVIDKIKEWRCRLKMPMLPKSPPFRRKDEEIGNIIAEAMAKVGKNGVVTVEEGKGVELEVDYKEGMEFDKGYASAYLVTNPEKMEAEDRRTIYFNHR